MTVAVKARTSGALAVKPIMTVDDLVTRIRRKVEKALPWFDEEEYKAEAARQEAVIASVSKDVAKAHRTLEAYKRAHELRR